MATFKTRVESIIGTVSSTTLLDTWLSSGAKFVLVQIPSQKLLGYSQEISFTSSVSLWNRKFVGLSVGGYEPKLVTPGKATQVADATSLHYATVLTPAYLVKGDTIFVFPTGATGSLFAVNYPDVVNTDTAIANFPPELEEGVVLYACITGLLQRSFDRLATDIAAMTFGSVTAPTAISGAISMTLSLPTFVQPVPLFDTTNAGTYIRTDEDIEKGNAELQIQQVLLSKYNEDIQNANAVFQADIAKYTTELAKEKAETDLEVQQYIARVQLYAQQIGYEVNKFSSYATKTKIYLETNQALASTLQAQLTALIQGFING